MPGMGVIDLPIDGQTVSADELQKFVSEMNMSTFVRMAIERPANADLTHAFAGIAQAAAARRRPVMVLAASDVAASSYQAALANAEALVHENQGKSLVKFGQIRIMTARDLALSMFDDVRVREATGRDGRVLDGNEMDVLMEDVKVSGIKPGRLREMLKFFYKSMSDCSAEEDKWLETGEEKKVFAILEENLEARRAMLPAELFGLAWRGMMDGKVGRKPMLILCDDWTALSKSAQRFVELMATEGLIVAGCENEAPVADEPYPNPEGFSKFFHRPNMTQVYVKAPAAVPEAEWSTSKTPAAEAQNAANTIADMVQEGAKPEEILVAVPNRAWAASVAASLNGMGVSAVADTGALKVKGDPRYPERCTAIKAAALEKLKANPADLTALRTYIGAGDWLLRSEAFLGVLAYARDHETTVAHALVELRQQPADERETAIFSKFDAAFDELEAADVPVLEAINQIEKQGVEYAAKAETLLDATSAVVVAPYDRAFGRHAKTTFILGLVNGYLPAKDAIDDSFTIEHRRNALVRERTRFDNLRATASEAVYASRFETDTLENATLSKAQVQRVFAANGKRMARLEPSVFSPDGAELPAVITCGPRKREEGALSTAC